ncbi:MAG: GFA family protein [Myxococcota bacterium]
MIRGSCLCGDVAWEYSGTPDFMGACHCSMCRKEHGAAFATAVAGSAEGYRLLRGKDSITGYESSPGAVRPFCSRCGSPVPPEPVPGRPSFMPAGCLDDDPGVRSSTNLFVASRAPWHEITDDVPSFDAYPPEIDAPVTERPRATEPRAGAARGSCLCGGIAYEIEGEHETILNCHCSRCQKAHGVAHASVLLVDPAQFRWLRGEELLQSYRVPDAQRFKHCFCRVCGSSLPEVHGDQVVAKIGTLDDDPGARPRCHIFTSSKAPWFDITDDLPQFEEYPTREL